MIFWISKHIAAIFGLDISVVQKRVLLAVFLLVFIAILFSALWLRSCLKKSPKLDEQEIQQAQQAVEDRNHERLAEILTNSDVKEKIITGEVANAASNTAAAKVEAKKKYDAMTPEQLAAELEARR